MKSKNRKFRIGQTVDVVAEPEDYFPDFTGTIVSIHGDTAIVRDQDNDAWSVEFDQMSQVWDNF